MSVPVCIRWGLIGPGRASARFCEGLAAVPHSSVVAVWGRSQIAAESLVGRYGGEVCDSIDCLLARKDVDAIYVGTHPDSHASFCLAALHAGKHVLCEKPSALNVSELEKILAAARSADRLWMEAIKSPFFPLYRRLREQLASDPIGPIGFVRAGHADASRDPHTYPTYDVNIGGGGLLGIGPYPAFLALDWLGPLRSVHAAGRKGAVGAAGAGVDVLALVTTEHEGGFAQLHTGLLLSSEGDALLSGTLGYAKLHANWWSPQKATVVYSDGRRVELDEPFSSGGFNYETAHFCDLVRAGARDSPIVSHDMSRSMARLLEEARKQLGVRYPSERHEDGEAGRARSRTRSPRQTKES